MRAEVLAHKRHRQAPIGPNLTLYFEDRVTMRYQVQEMLRAERIFESEAIAEELAAYNPLIPDGTNLKATMMLEYPDVAERRPALERLKGVENSVYLEVGNARARVRLRRRGSRAQRRDEDVGRAFPAVRARRGDARARSRAARRSRSASITSTIATSSTRSAELRKSLAADLD